MGYNPAGCSGAALLVNQSLLEQSLTAESYPHFDAHGCDGGCDCDWLPSDNCQEQSWCCAWACRDKYHNPAGCSDPGSEYGQIEWGGCDGGCNCDWLSRDNCQDTEWCCAGACRDYYYNPAGCSGAALLANQSQLWTFVLLRGHLERKQQLGQQLRGPDRQHRH